MASNRKLVTLSDRTLEMIEDIKAQIGMDKTSQVITRGVEELYKNYSKYGKALGDKVVSDDVAIEKVAERKEKLRFAQEKARLELKLAPKIHICEVDLEGEVITQENGTKICKWYTHDVNGDYEQVIGLNQVGEYLISNLYQPDKATVLKAKKA